jgi:hypothetical protein
MDWPASMLRVGCPSKCTVCNIGFSIDSQKNTGTWRRQRQLIQMLIRTSSLSVPRMASCVSSAADGRMKLSRDASIRHRRPFLLPAHDVRAVQRFVSLSHKAGRESGSEPEIWCQRPCTSAGRFARRRRRSNDMRVDRAARSSVRTILQPFGARDRLRGTSMVGIWHGLILLRWQDQSEDQIEIYLRNMVMMSIPTDIRYSERVVCPREVPSARWATRALSRSARFRMEVGMKARRIFTK